MMAGYFYSLLCSAYLWQSVGASHFYGGSINWRSLGNNVVHFEYTASFELGSGPCSSPCVLGSPGSPKGAWQCTSGCGTSTTVGLVQSTTTGINMIDRWETGEGSFDHSFSGQGSFVVGFATPNCCWRSLNYSSLSSGVWNVETTIILGNRSDTGVDNRSPRVLGPPIIRLQHGCNEHVLKFPLVDSDGDRVNCRWASGAECGSICRVLPNATVSTVGSNCIITLNTNTSFYYIDQWYGLALTVEDFSRTGVNIGNSSFTATDPLSAVPLQVLIHTPAFNSSCSAVPTWVADTPAAGTLVPYNTSAVLELQLYVQASSGTTVQSITVHGVENMQVSPSSGVALDDQGRPNVYMVNFSWTPAVTETGLRPLCFQTYDSDNKTGEFRCVTLYNIAEIETEIAQSGTSQILGLKEILLISGGGLLLLLLILLIAAVIRRCKKRKHVVVTKVIPVQKAWNSTPDKTKSSLKIKSSSKTVREGSCKALSSKNLRNHSHLQQLNKPQTDALFGF